MDDGLFKINRKSQIELSVVAWRHAPRRRGLLNDKKSIEFSKTQIETAVENYNDGELNKP